MDTFLWGYNIEWRSVVVVVLIAFLRQISHYGALTVACYYVNQVDLHFRDLPNPAFEYRLKREHPPNGARVVTSNEVC